MKPSICMSAAGDYKHFFRYYAFAECVCMTLSVNPFIILYQFSLNSFSSPSPSYTSKIRSKNIYDDKPRMKVNTIGVTPTDSKVWLHNKKNR